MKHTTLPAGRLAPADFYDRNAEAFFQASAFADMSPLRARFLAHLPSPADLLDAGCGSGRDALAFHRDGHRVTAFDASAEMVRLARAHTGLPVRQMAFEDMDWETAFDGIWACASLLHVPRMGLPRTLGAFHRALRPGGVSYLSLKHGATEREEGGRRFTDVLPDEIAGLALSQGFEVLDLWPSSDVRPRTAQLWVNVLLCKLP